MPETVNQGNATNNQEQGQLQEHGQVTQQSQPQDQSNEKLFTQDQVNAFFNRRYSELMSQVNEFKEKAQKYDEIEEANKSELQKANERADKLQTELDSIKKAESLKKMREKVAKEAGIPVASMSLITAETEEACKEQAETILSMITPGTYPQIPDGGEITKGNNRASVRDQFSAWASQQLNN